MKKLKPCFIVFEGTEGAGKTTALEGLLKCINNDYVRSREPGGTAAGEAIRNILLHPKLGPGLSPTVNALLFAASYRNSLHEKIIPALESGQCVISDRINISSFCYQAESEHIETLLKLNDSLRKPDIVFVMTTSYSVLKDRLKGRSDDLNNWRDNVKEDHHNFLKAGYERYAEMYPEHTVVIEPLQTPEAILEQIIHTLEKRFGVEE
jgi:dTMP kinase